MGLEFLHVCDFGWLWVLLTLVSHGLNLSLSMWVVGSYSTQQLTLIYEFLNHGLTIDYSYGVCPLIPNTSDHLLHLPQQLALWFSCKSLVPYWLKRFSKDSTTSNKCNYPRLSFSIFSSFSIWYIPEFNTPSTVYRWLLLVLWTTRTNNT